MMWRTEDGSTGRLIQLSMGYFIFYIITGISVKYFLSSGMSDMGYLVYSTGSSTLFATGVVLALRWFKLETVRPVTWMGITFPSELLYIIPSGVMTAVVIPTTTLLYSFKGISVMVAMVIMRGSVIIIGRIVDAIQIRQGILTKKVYLEENLGVLFAIIAVSVKVLSGGNSGGANPFTSLPVVIIFSSYIVAYAIRIYIMNYYKNTRPKYSKVDNNKAFFGIEQIASTTTLWIVTGVLLLIVTQSGWSGPRITPFANAFSQPELNWGSAAFWGTAFGVVAFFSVFLFMFKGRTATFAGLVNRLTSLIAGTASTLLFALFWSGKWPKMVDWISLLFILIAVGFIAVAEKKRSAELALEKSNRR
ncbi:MAG TPA: hypothetical protein ENN84_06515 [Candidatus Marinimicrobia bacterium]|nr:hypothetical protein [Candidatus Neomarinimicrobiota bacterium]